ncbi:hypothetical protein OpiT1DRAFT_05305 [Opitutaceae bacterium TAV1]|nr:hypothetical protein OpiT1DRAFT_05305 [Opitutaceae bacterium TAV1]
MALALFNDALDDDPATAGCDGFTGSDFASKPNLLTPDTLRAGENVWMDADQLVQTRPGLRFAALLHDAAPLAETSARVQGMGYYDTPEIERVLAARAGKIYEIAGDGPGAVSGALAGVAVSPAGAVRFAQLVDRMFYVDGAGRLRWSIYTPGDLWTHGEVTQFSNDTDMPLWRTICAHAFRMLAVDKDGRRIYVSAVGEANAAANWQQTDNLRVGTGEGDPIETVISAMGGNVIVLCSGSAWSVDTTEASPGAWVIIKVTDVAGCVAGRTAVALGQDVIFLSRWGVVSLGALATTDSINAAATLSAAIQPLIDRINWQAIGSSWATVWGDLYLLAIPLDTEAMPTRIFPYNVRTRRWMTPWSAALSGLLLGELPGGAAVLGDEAGQYLVDETGTLLLDSGRPPAQPLDLVEFEGFSAAVVSRFGGRAETLLGDSTGRVLKIDLSYEKDDNSPDSSQDVPSWATIKSHDFDLPAHMKQPFWLQVLFNKSTARGVQLNLVRDGLLTYPDRTLEECEVIDNLITTGTLGVFPIVFPLQFRPNAMFTVKRHIRGFPRFIECGLQVYCARGRMRLRTVRFAAFVDTPELL